MGHVVVTVWHWPPVCGLKLAWGCGGSWWQTLADGWSSAPDVVLPSRNVQQQQQQQGSASPASQLAALCEERRAPSGRLSPNLFCNQLSAAAKALLLCLPSTFVSDTDTSLRLLFSELVLLASYGDLYLIPTGNLRCYIHLN